MEEVQEVTQEIMEVQQELKDMAKFGKPGWPIDGTNLDEIKKMLVIYQ